MSYILEALKKSQQERELGQVPTLEMGPFAGVRRPHRGNPWALAALGLAGLAVAIALFAVLRQPQTTAPAPQITAAPASPAVAQLPVPNSPGDQALAQAQVGPVAPPLPTPSLIPPPAGPVLQAPGVPQALPNGADPACGDGNGPMAGRRGAPVWRSCPTPGLSCPSRCRWVTQWPDHGLNPKAWRPRNGPKTGWRWIRRSARPSRGSR